VGREKEKEKKKSAPFLSLIREENKCWQPPWKRRGAKWELHGKREKNWGGKSLFELLGERREGWDARGERRKIRKREKRKVKGKAYIRS